MLLHGELNTSPGRGLSTLATMALVAVLGGQATAQVGTCGPLSGPVTVQVGGTFEVQVASTDSAVGVSTGGPGTYHPVPPSGRVTIPVPPELRGGMVLMVFIGRGLQRHVIVIEVIEP